MKALAFQEHGGLDQLTIMEIPTPVPDSDQVQVRLRASALNRMDLWTLEGWPGLDLEMPHIPGADGAGVISAIGSHVRGVKVGERVVINPNLSCGRCEFCLAGLDNMCRDWHLLGETRRGTMAEYVSIPATNVLPLPDHISFEQAAAAALVFLTGWHSLITRGKLQAGETVLIIGASGGVNTACIQIAKLAGAVVYAVGSDAGKVELAESLGADIVFDRSAVDNWSKEVYLATGKRGVDVVVDNVGQATMGFSLRSARKGGRILTVGNTSGPVFEIDNRYIFGKHVSIIGSTMGTHHDFRQVMGLIFKGVLHPVLDQVYPLEGAEEAFRRLEAGDQQGKIVLSIPEGENGEPLRSG